MCLAGDFPAGQHPRCGTPPPGPTPHSIDRVLPHSPGRCLTGARLAKTAEGHSERCCGIPASSARTSVSRYRRCPPSVRIEVSLPAFAHRVTVLGSTRNIVATSAGVSSGSASGVRADICVASPPGPVVRSCVPVLPGAPAKRVGDVQIWPDKDNIAITSGDASPTRCKFLYRNAQFLSRLLSLRVSLATLIVASRRIHDKRPAKYRPPSPPEVPGVLLVPEET